MEDDLSIDNHKPVGYIEDSAAKSNDDEGQTEETGLTESDDYEDYEEIDEEMFLKAATTTVGGANAPSIKNQIS